MVEHDKSTELEQAVAKEIRKAAMRGDRLTDAQAQRRLQARLLALQAGERGWAA